MKVWRVLVTGVDGKGTGEQFQDRWRAEEAFEAAKAPDKSVTLAEFVNGQQTEIVRDSRFESHSQRS